MRMFVPEIGTRIVLDEDWTFPLHKERRNDTVFRLIAAGQQEVALALEAEGRRLISEAVAETPREGENYGSYLERRSANILRANAWVKLDVTLPAGTTLTLDRIYVRKGVSDYSSLSFNLNATPHPALNVRGRKRFWAKLEDANRIVFSLAE